MAEVRIFTALAEYISGQSLGIIEANIYGAVIVLALSYLIAKRTEELYVLPFILTLLLQIIGFQIHIIATILFGIAFLIGTLQHNALLNAYIDLRGGTRTK